MKCKGCGKMPCMCHGGRMKMDDGGVVSSVIDSAKKFLAPDFHEAEKKTSMPPPVIYSASATKGYSKGGEVKGVHKPLPRLKGQSESGRKLRAVDEMGSGKDGWVDHQEKVKQGHEDVLEELKSMPKPKLQGLAHGGKVDMYAMKPDVPAMHGMDEGGDVEKDMGEETDHELMDACASEFMEGHEKKDKKQMLDALKAIWHSSKE